MNAKMIGLDNHLSYIGNGLYESDGSAADEIHDFPNGGIIYEYYGNSIIETFNAPPAIGNNSSWPGAGIFGMYGTIQKGIVTRDVDKKITRNIQYLYGKKTLRSSVKQTVRFVGKETYTMTTNGIQKSSNIKVVGNASWKQVNSPIIQNYIPDKKLVAKKAIKVTSKNENVIVSYYPRAILRVSDSNEKNKVKNTLKNPQDSYTYTLSQFIPNKASKASYLNNYSIRIPIDRRLKIVSVSKNKNFKISIKGNVITITAIKQKQASFYNKTYKFNIKVKPKSTYSYDYNPKARANVTLNGTKYKTNEVSTKIPSLVRYVTVTSYQAIYVPQIVYKAKTVYSSPKKCDWVCQIVGNFTKFGKIVYYKSIEYQKQIVKITSVFQKIGTAAVKAKPNNKIVNIATTLKKVAVAAVQPKPVSKVANNLGTTLKKVATAAVKAQQKITVASIAATTLKVGLAAINTKPKETVNTLTTILNNMAKAIIQQAMTGTLTKKEMLIEHQKASTYNGDELNGHWKALNNHYENMAIDMFNDGEYCNEELDTLKGRMRVVCSTSPRTPEQAIDYTQKQMKYLEELRQQHGDAYVRGYIYTMDNMWQYELLITGLLFLIPGPRIVGVTREIRLLGELTGRGKIDYTLEDIIFITKTPEGKLLWLEKGNNKNGLQHIVNRKAKDFARRGIKETDVLGFLKKVLKQKPIEVNLNSRGYEAIYLVNGKEYLVAYGTNGYISTFYPYQGK